MKQKDKQSLCESLMNYSLLLMWWDIIMGWLNIQLPIWVGSFGAICCLGSIGYYIFNYPRWDWS